MSRFSGMLPAWSRNRLTRYGFGRRLRNRSYGGPLLSGPAPGELRAVVYLATWARWDVMVQRPQYVLAEFARKGHPVYFVDPREPASRTMGQVHIVPSLEQVPYEGVILYVHYAPVEAQFYLFDDPAILYDITEDLSIYADREGETVTETARAHHDSVIAIADVVSASSPGQAEHYRSERPDLYLAPNGVDPERFAGPRPRPGDLPNDGRPLAGYHGAIADWRFDWELFAGVAAALPDWWFPLVGPVDPRDATNVSGLARLPNVIRLGERGPDALPGYVNAFDVGTMWYPRNPVTENAVPMKLYEYLAAGKPCVSTSLPACEAAQGVWTADDVAGFVAALEEALAAGATDEFAAVAAAETDAAAWSKRLEPVFAALERAGLLRVAGR
jgi:glycosyltransferase involved in cell wall biosynthesis